MWEILYMEVEADMEHATGRINYQILILNVNPLFRSNGKKYQGNWLNGKQHGYGVIIWYIFHLNPLYI